MDGVTILNETEIVEVVNDTFNYAAGAIALLVTVLICAIVGFFIGRLDFSEFEGTLIGIMAGLVSVLIGLEISGLAALLLIIPFGAMATKTLDTVDYYKHEVMIDETVNMTEFLDKYEIVDERGKILTVIEDVN